MHPLPLHPTPYTLHPTPSQTPTPYTLHPTPSQTPTPYTLSTPYTPQFITNFQLAINY
ncbi:hypothetical protein [Planktothricoides raciborskii]|nr:hypothetical protein [Planktothricoides raciborskii]